MSNTDAMKFRDLPLGAYFRPSTGGVWVKRGQRSSFDARDRSRSDVHAAGEPVELVAGPADAWTERARLFQKLDAGHNGNGNPRRRTVYYDTFGNILAVCDLGYSSEPTWARYAGRRGELHSLPDVATTPSELRAFDAADPRGVTS